VSLDVRGLFECVKSHIKRILCHFACEGSRSSDLGDISSSAVSSGVTVYSPWHFRTCE
jgi:hypothetical protein